MAPTNPIGRDPVTGKLSEFTISASDAGVFDGGNASSVWTGQPKIDAGAAV